MEKCLPFIFIGFCWAFLNFKAVAQGGRMLGMGKIEAALQDGWSVLNNPSGLASAKEPEILLGYEQKYLLNDLTAKAMGVVMPLKQGVVGVSIVSSGFFMFRRNEVNLNYSTHLTKKLAVGIRLSYLDIKSGNEFSSQKLLGADVGFHYQLKENLIMAVFADNVASWMKGKSEPHLEQTSPKMAIGLGYKLSPKVLLASEFTKEFLVPYRFKLGLEYEVAQGFTLRSGIYTGRLTNTFGMGYKLKQLRLDVGCERHPVLGYSFNCAFSYRLKRKNTGNEG